MSEMQMNNPNPTTIQIQQETEPKPLLTRQQESQKRKEEFFAEMEKARATENTPTVAKMENIERVVNDNNDEIINDIPEVIDDDSDLLENKAIPKKRFDKEIEKRKVLETELARERESRIKYETELSLYNKALDQMQAQQNKPQIAPEIDPIDTDAHNLYMKRINELEQQFQNQNNNLNEYQVKQQFAQAVDRQASEFSQKNPDFQDAYDYLLHTEAKKVKDLGYNEEQANAYAMEQLRPIAAEVYKQGKNVAEFVYNMARNYGYRGNKEKIPSKIDSPSFDNVSKNMPKSHSIIDEVPGVSTAVAQENAAYHTLEGFTKKLSGKMGRGTDIEEFYKAMDRLRKNVV